MRISDWSSDVCSSDLRLRSVERHAETVEIILEDDVDHARDGVRTINRRCTAGDYFDALDQVGVDRIEVDRGAVGGAGDAALAVDEHERAVRAATGEIDEREPSARSEEHTSELPTQRRPYYAASD